MVKFFLPWAALRPVPTQILRYANHAAWPGHAHAQGAQNGTPKILGKCRPVEFDEKSPRIRVDIAQKRRFNPNDSFKPVWYCFVQRRRKGCRG
jgi:hypothetical protein